MIFSKGIPTKNGPLPSLIHPMFSVPVTWANQDSRPKGVTFYSQWNPSRQSPKIQILPGSVFAVGQFYHLSGQIIIFHQPGFSFSVRPLVLPDLKLASLGPSIVKASTGSLSPYGCVPSNRMARPRMLYAKHPGVLSVSQIECTSNCKLGTEKAIHGSNSCLPWKQAARTRVYTTNVCLYADVAACAVLARPHKLYKTTDLHATPYA